MSDRPLWPLLPSRVTPLPTRPVPSVAARGLWAAWASQYGLLAGFLVLTFLLSGSSISRPFFIAGCAGLGWLAWRRGVAAHVELVVLLFVAAPFLRRVTDYHVGWDPSGVMLAGPLFALLVACVELSRLLMTVPPSRRAALIPLVLYGACVTYAWLVSALQGNIFQASTAALRYAAPLLYGVWLICRAEPQAALAGATRAFAIILPIIGVYGIMQWLNPLEWDRYWMLMAPMDSIGLPLPQQVRVFGPLNSPASYAMFITCGLLLVMNARRGLLTLMLAAPACVGLLLSQFRTAWIGLAVGLAFFMILPRTRRRSVLFVVFLVVAVTVVATATPFADVVTKRLETLQSSPTQDGSGSARLEQGQYLLNHLDDFMFGYGLAPASSDYRIQQAFLADGVVIISFIDMGLVVGTISLIALGWAGLMAISRGWGVREPLVVAASGIVAAQLIDVPLTGVTTGELGFLNWTFIAILISLGARPKSPRVGTATR